MPEDLKRREKELASDRRAGVWSRALARNRQRAFARRNWSWLLLAAIAIFLPFLLIASFESNDFLRGCLVGGGVVTTVSGLSYVVLLFSGTAPTIMGDLAEQWTAQELRSLTDHGWRLVNHFGLGYGDNDHVLVGPGGVILVETKWSATDWDVRGDDRRVRAALAQLSAGAKRLGHWHGMAGHGVRQVSAVLVLWGQTKDVLPAGGLRVPDEVSPDTVVLHGRDLNVWALRRGRDKLTAEQVDGIWAAMDRQVRDRDAVDEIRNPLPRSIAELVLTAAGCLAVTALAVVTAAQVVTASNSLWMGGAYTVLSLFVGVVAIKRTRRTRALAYAWTAGTAIAVLLACVAVA